tara:strand:+ start:1016 stop:2881 length:1866 start_codon:yes stop_codon:yes gene_type:complete
MARLEVEIGANIKDFQSKLSQALKGFDTLKREEKALSVAFKEGVISADRYYDALAVNSSKLKNTSKQINNYKSNIDGVGKGMGKMSRGVASGSSAMTAFSRTVQDAPFGIMGVSNNITNLTEQFGYLKNKTGSAKGALSAMLKDLKGFGGISLAVSVVTSLLLVFGDKIFKTKDKVKDLKKEQEKLTNSLNNYVLGLEAVNQASLKGQKRATKEITTLGLLKSQLNNTNLSLNERKGAIEELRKKYPKYLKNLSDEKLLNGGLETVYNTLTTSIIKRAKATASMNAIVKNSETLLVLESQLLSEKLKLTAAEDKYNSAIKTTTASSISGVNTTTQRTKKAIEQQKKIVDELIGKMQNLELTNIDLEANITTTTGGVTMPFIEPNLKDVFVGFTEKYKEEKQKFQDVVADDPLIIDADNEWSAIDWTAYYNLKQFDENKQKLIDALNKVNEEAKSIISGGMANTFSGIGQAIGNALSSGTTVIGAIGLSLLSSLGNFLSDMGGMLIKYGTLAVLKGKLDLAILSGGPVAIGAGIAAIAVGVALTAAGAAIGSFASSGGNSSNASGGSGSNSGGFSGSSSGGFSSSSGGGTVVFEIAGTKLVGVLSNTLRRNRNLGGSLSLTD